MMLKGKRIGFGITGSHCTYEAVFPIMEQLVEMGADVVPVVSYTVQNVDTRFGKAEDHLQRMIDITGNEPIRTIVEAEELGPKRPVDCMVVAPLTGNTMSKMANAITDTPILMATKATMRNESPIVLALATNDALGLNGVNLMRLIATKGIFFTPFGQDDYVKKPNSIVSKMELIPETIEHALNFKQLQPILQLH